MLTLFAKRNTSEKVLIFCKQNERPKVQFALNQKCGGDWIVVDRFYLVEDYLKFDDGIEYKGYSPKIKRYAYIGQTKNLLD